MGYHQTDMDHSAHSSHVGMDHDGHEGHGDGHGGHDHGSGHDMMMMIVNTSPEPLLHPFCIVQISIWDSPVFSILNFSSTLDVKKKFYSINGASIQLVA